MITIILAVLIFFGLSVWAFFSGIALFLSLAFVILKLAAICGGIALCVYFALWVVKQILK